MAIRTRSAPSETPPIVPWAQWFDEFSRTWTWREENGVWVQQGQHLLFVGPTQSGKTLLARKCVSLRSYVIVFGTKPKDPSLDEYIAEGYKRIDNWPPRARDLKPDDNGNVHLILWPKITTIDDLKKFRSVYQKCLNSVFVEGCWTLVLDEGIWLASRGGLKLGEEVAAIAYASASSLVNMCLLVQRPSGLPPIAWSSVADALIFHGGITRDIRELASLGTYDPRDVSMVVQGLQGRNFLDLPTRAQKEWSVTSVVK